MKFYLCFQVVQVNLQRSRNKSLAISIRPAGQWHESKLTHLNFDIQTDPSQRTGRQLRGLTVTSTMAKVLALFDSWVSTYLQSAAWNHSSFNSYNEDTDNVDILATFSLSINVIDFFCFCCRLNLHRLSPNIIMLGGWCCVVFIVTVLLQSTVLIAYSVR